MALTAGVLFGFPALAIWARRRGGSRLGFATGAAVAVVVAFSVLAASQQFGNRISMSANAGSTVTGVVLLFGFTFGIPVVAASLAVNVLSRDRLPFWAVYAATVGAAAFGWMLGVIGATWIFPMFL